MPTTPRPLALILLVCAAAAPAPPAIADTFVVDSLVDDTFANDSDPGDGICDDSFPSTSACTLRAAIEEANALAGADRIEFSVSGEIGPDAGNLGPLPIVTDALVIDGTTAPGWSPLEPTLYLDGTAIDAGESAFAAGLEVTGGTLEVFGLGITGFPYAQIEFDNGSAGGRVDGCVLGLDATGAPDPHPESLSGAGIRVMSDNAVIGRTGPPGNVAGHGNVISGNRLYGIEIRGDGNEVLGNIIGMSADGLLARGNGAAGVILFSFSESADNNRIGGGNPGDGSGNHIANNEGVAVLVSGTGNVVDGNTFGYKPGTGVFFSSQTSAISVRGDGHTIGGTSGNRIIDRNSGTEPIIEIGVPDSTGGLPATNVQVVGNRIGTQTVSLGSRYGIRVAVDGSTGNTIEENRINNTTFAIEVSTDGNTVTGNLLGVDPELGPGNRWGIRVLSASNNDITLNTIGNSDFEGIVQSGSSNRFFGNDIGFAAGIGAVANGRGGIEVRSGTDILIQANRIRNNAGPGIGIRDVGSIHGLTIVGNSIRFNTGIGIDFLEFGGSGIVPGPTLNDPGDSDGGANRKMNYPEFGEAVPIPGTSPTETEVTFRVDSDPANQAYPITVDFYRADRYGARQGGGILGSVVYDTFGVEEAVTLTLPAGVEIDRHYTALATDADGNTSEFAPARSLGEVLFRDGYED